MDTTRVARPQRRHQMPRPGKADSAPKATFHLGRARLRTATPPCRRAIALPSPSPIRSIWLKTRSSGTHVDVLLHAADGLDAPLAVGCGGGGGDDVEDHRRVGQFLKRGAKGGDEVRRQVANEPHGVGDDDLALVRELQVLRRGVEGREHLVGDVHWVCVRARSSVLLPAFVLPTMDSTGTVARPRRCRRFSRSSGVRRSLGTPAVELWRSAGEMWIGRTLVAGASRAVAWRSVVGDRGRAETATGHGFNSRRLGCWWWSARPGWEENETGETDESPPWRCVGTPRRAWRGGHDALDVASPAGGLRR